MNFARGFICAFCAAVFVVSSFAQDKTSAHGRPELTGAWVRNLSKSKNVGSASVTLTISHKEPEIKITRREVVDSKETLIEAVYYTDGRGELNASRFGAVMNIGAPSPNAQSHNQNLELRSKTKWEGNKLVTRSEVSADVLGTIDVTEKRELSTDGKTLTVTTRFGMATFTEVFDRVH